MASTSPKTWIVVPTYWTFPSGERGEEQTVFDHPTPLDEEGTLRRTLESFRVLDGEFAVLVVAACAHGDLGEATGRRVRELIAPLADDLRLYLVAPGDIGRLNGLLTRPILALDSYGNIRNVQLLVPFAAGAEVVIGIDDDEVIEDPAYLAKTLEFIGRDHRGETVSGMAGPYLDRGGQYRIAGAEALREHGNLFVMKNFHMNEALKGVMERPCPQGIVKSNVAFCGNMCMARGMIGRVCHDPYIPRGEDYDYVINAAMSGLWFYFRPDMSVVHLPPDSTGSQAADKPSKLVADIRRFLYMREKHRYHAAHLPAEAMDIEYLMPYPGVYLDEGIDLAAHAVAALDELHPEFRQRQSPEALVAEATERARLKAAEFFVYRQRWRRTLEGLDGACGLADAVRGLRIEGT